jgi:hypothetical protein
VRKLKAFTIVELIVVMIISIITLATIYTVYLLVKKQYASQYGKTEALNNSLQFKNVLTSDFTNADSVKSKIDEQLLICYLDSSVITYEFTDRAIIRQYNNFSDSFVLFPHNLDIVLYDNSELVDQVTVKIVPYADTVLLQWVKQYDATSLIKIKAD